MTGGNKLIVGLLFVIFSVVVLVKISPKKMPAFDDRQKIEAQLGNSPSLILEVVNTPASTTLGLSGRDNIGADGMLFIFNNAQIRSFWMKDMKFALDLIWLNDNEVVNISTNVPAPTSHQSDRDLPTISSQVPADMVLEVLSGSAQQWQLAVGDQLIIK